MGAYASFAIASKAAASSLGAWAARPAQTAAGPSQTAQGRGGRPSAALPTGPSSEATSRSSSRPSQEPSSTARAARFNDAASAPETQSLQGPSAPRPDPAGSIAMPRSRQAVSKATEPLSTGASASPRSLSAAGSLAESRMTAAAPPAIRLAVSAARRSRSARAAASSAPGGTGVSITRRSPWGGVSCP